MLLECECVLLECVLQGGWSHTDRQAVVLSSLKVRENFVYFIINFVY